MADKRCTNPKCKNPWKPESEFSLNRTTLDGLQSWCKECVREYNKKNKQLRQDYRLEYLYGFLPGDKEKISKSQDHKCLICKEIKTLVPDHNHKTGRFRALICQGCNIRVGLHENHPVKEYLEQPEWKFLLIWPSPRNDRDRRLRRKYNICLDDYDMMFETQNGVCGICDKSTKRNLCTDHDWNTGRVRGLLCGSCNRKLGQDDNSNILNYLKQNTPLIPQ